LFTRYGINSSRGCIGRPSPTPWRTLPGGVRFTSAINADDYATICNELITARLASRFLSATGNRRDCKYSSARADLLGNPALRGLTPSAVSARGSTATVRLNESPVYLKLKRTPADGWRITAIGESP